MMRRSIRCVFGIVGAFGLLALMSGHAQAKGVPSTVTITGVTPGGSGGCLPPI